MSKTNESYTLLRRLVKGGYTCAEGKEGLKVLRDDTHRKLVDQCMHEVWDETLDATAEQSILEYNYRLKEAKQLLERTKVVPGTTRRWRPVAMLAAAVLLVAVMGYWLVRLYHPAVHEVYTEVSTGYGEHKGVVLPDGTVVSLNACSRLKYPQRFVDHERRVTLEGEAYFEVARQEQQAFVVTTQYFDVKVLGTVFNIKAYKGTLMQGVDVQHGKVQVDMPEGMARLGAQEQLELDTRNSNYAKRTSDYEQVAVWRMGTLRFEKTPVRDIAKELERVYHCSIVFDQGQQFDNLISGEHDNEGLTEVLESIRLASGIKWRRGNDGHTIVMYK